MDLCLHILSFLVEARDLAGLLRLWLRLVDGNPGLERLHPGLQMTQVRVHFFWHGADQTLLMVFGDIIRIGIN